jgi:hypothetical protein
MYDMLTDAELNVLQLMLFEGSEKAFSMAGENVFDPHSAQCHRELAGLFLEAGTELSRRLRHTPVAA